MSEYNLWDIIKPKGNRRLTAKEKLFKQKLEEFEQQIIKSKDTPVNFIERMKILVELQGYDEVKTIALWSIFCGAIGFLVFNLLVGTIIATSVFYLAFLNNIDFSDFRYRFRRGNELCECTKYKILPFINSCCGCFEKDVLRIKKVKAESISGLFYLTESLDLVYTKIVVDNFFSTLDKKGNAEKFNIISSKGAYSNKPTSIMSYNTRNKSEAPEQVKNSLEELQKEYGLSAADIRKFNTIDVCEVLYGLKGVALCNEAFVSLTIKFGTLKYYLALPMRGSGALNYWPLNCMVDKKNTAEEVVEKI